MKIVDVKAVYPRYRQPLGEWRGALWQMVVRVTTDAGVVGHGFGGGGLAALPIVNHHFRQLLTGRRLDSAQDIASIWDDLYTASIPYGRKGVAIMALSGVDLALWDALGRAERVPVVQLLGGRRKTRVRAYATGGDTEWYAELGYTAHKFSHRWSGEASSYDAAEAQAALARSLFGTDALLMVDCYMSWDAAVTLGMAQRLAPYRLHWFEDVLTPDRLDEQADLRETIRPVHLAGGEHEFTHHGFAEMARTAALDIWQPDITWCGGITAGLRIMELARQADVRVVPHRGGEVWGLHFILATTCEDLAEVLPGSRQSQPDRLWLGEPVVERGFLAVGDEPGFGVVSDDGYL